MKSIYKYLLFASLAALAVVLIMLAMGKGAQVGPPLSIFLLLLAIGLRGHHFFKGFSFSIIIFSAVTLAMFYPGPFTQVGDFQMRSLIVPLLQIIMFGMGTAMSLKDFIGVIKMPKSVGVGLVCQFTIMPIIGFTMAKLFGFSNEVAAGIILIGSSPSGLASNVMSYLAKANIALSVTLTAVATMLAPLMTPLWMKWLAAQYIPIDFWSMMWSIIKIVIIPVFGGLAFNHFFHGKTKWLDKAMPLVSMAGIALIIAIITAAGRDSLLTIGIALIIAGILHNGLGYFLGYWASKFTGSSEQDARTIAFEVGMQNAGLASGIALEMGKLGTVGLAAAVFGPWMNISGSSLATWWREKSNDEEVDENPKEAS